MLYVPNGFGLAEAIDPKTGHTLWTQKPLIDGPEGLPSLMISKGVAYWGRGDDARILTVRQQHLFALNPQTGEPIASFGDGGKVDLTTPEFRYKWAGVPVVAGDVVVVGSSMLEQDSAVYKDGPPGDVRAFDVRTGKPRWTFQRDPARRRPGHATWQDDSWRYTRRRATSGRRSASTTSSGSCTCRRRAARTTCTAATGSATTSTRSSIVCLDAKTGERVWHFQTVHHDLFDYDLPAAPILIDITVDGRDDQSARASHEARLRVRARSRRPASPCGRSRSAPCRSRPCRARSPSPTQPYPTKPPPYEHQGLTEDDLIDFTPELRAEALEIVKRYVIGPPFTPPSVIGKGRTKLGTIQLAGASGGANWNGGAFDPETGMFYVGVAHGGVRRGPVRAGSRALGSALSRRHARDHERPARVAADEAAVRPHHGVRLESRRAGSGWCRTATGRGTTRRSRR